MLVTGEDATRAVRTRSTCNCLRMAQDSASRVVSTGVILGYDTCRPRSPNGPSQRSPLLPIMSRHTISD